MKIIVFAKCLIERIATKAVLPATDFSYDFHRLDLRYVRDQGGKKRAFR